MKKPLSDCPVETTLQLIGDKWKILIIRDLLDGTKRFNELKKSLTGITQKVLTSKLRDMEDSGLLTRKIYPEVPPKVEYSLTNLGSSLFPILENLAAWGDEYKKGAVSKWLKFWDQLLFLFEKEKNREKISVKWYN